MTTNVFDQLDEDHNNEDTDYLAELVGDDKPFKTVADLAKGKHNSDQFIEQLKKEAKELREQLDQRLTAEQVLEKLKGTTTSPNTPADQGGERDVETDTKPSLQDKDIEEKFKELYASERQAERDRRNGERANNDLIAYFGSVDDAAKALAEKSKELGFTVAELQATAARSPDALYALMGLDRDKLRNSATRRGTASPSEGTANTDGTVTHTGMEVNGRKTYKAYQKILADDPRKYFTPEVQNQMFKDSIALGDEFYNS